MLYSVSDFNIPAEKRITDLVGITKEQFPLIALISPNNQGWDKYIFNEEDLTTSLTRDKISEFITHYKQGTLRRYLRSEDGMNELILEGSIYTIKGN